MKPTASYSAYREKPYKYSLASPATKVFGSN